jgi:hypothetical protein
LAGAIALFLGISASAQTNGIPLFQFAVFYNSLLEFTWCPPMTINGRVHANGDIYTGSAWQLAFNDQVTLTGNLSSPPWGGYNASQYTKPATFFAPTVTNASALTLNTGLPNTTTALREIINLPPPGEDSNSLIGQQRYFNKAKVVLVVTDSNIVATIKSSATDPSPGVISAAYYPTNNHWTNYAGITNSFPFLNRTNYWPTSPVPVIDQRENVTLKLTDIDLSIFKSWLVTNALLVSKFANGGGVYPNSTDAPNILFVADNRTCSATQLAAVRLNHCQIIPTNLFVFNGSNTASGFTLATPNPLYIWGTFNVPNAAYVGSTNTTAAGAYPASLIADAITILSDNWRDSQSSLSMTSRTPTPTTINAAIAAGIVYSTGASDTTFSGGIQNLPRLLENWSASKTLTLNGSLVNLFPSGRATNQYEKPGVYYNAPARGFSFDPNLLQSWKLPPGTPLVGPNAPAITSQPTNQITTKGQTISFTQAHTGLEPMSYQWHFNGTNALVSATKAKLTLTNVQPTDAGDYSVAISNAYGIVTSQPASLTVYVTPSITPPMHDIAVLAGQSAAWSPSASGTEPLAFQWQFNGTDIADATGASLILTNAEPEEAGTYSLIVSNIAGSITNSATLSVYSTPAATLILAPALSPDHFQFAITGVPGFNYVVEASTNLLDWEPLLTNTSPFTLTDNQITNYPARYYRSVYAP